MALAVGAGLLSAIRILGGRGAISSSPSVIPGMTIRVFGETGHECDRRGPAHEAGQATRLGARWGAAEWAKCAEATDSRPGRVSSRSKLRATSAEQGEAPRGDFERARLPARINTRASSAIYRASRRERGDVIVMETASPATHLSCDSQPSSRAEATNRCALGVSRLESGARCSRRIRWG